ncbi:extracellular solute-binding protein [Psychromonas aquatilis]|uniref:Extracellular solute-binding protein n=1 Tax=Psychromonas aquatilis TaxID=2005072 RepID=A0ABU9GL97_9GAMM
MIINNKLVSVFISIALVFTAERTIASSWQTSLSMYGDIKYQEGFKHFDYVDPNATKGGTFKQASIGSFDSLNPYIVKGNAAAGITHIYDTLLQQSADEPFSLYPLIAEKVKVADDFSWVSFLINSEAKFEDGKPITAEDVKFSFDLLIKEGSPLYASYYAGVESVEVDSTQQVTFHFAQSGNRELPLIIGQIPVFPKHFWKDKDFTKSGLLIPIGSGPYKIKSFDAGKQITFQRNSAYWAKDLPVNKGRFNFDQLIFDYYRDDSVAFEAFKSGAFDYRLETSSKRWATGYVGEQFNSDKIILETIEDKSPQGMQGFWFNLRRDKFKDPNVREAISLLFDFEWANKTLFYGAYTRINSFYSGSELSTGINISDAEREILSPYAAQLNKSVFEPIQTNITLGNGNVRKQMRQAVALLSKAGYELKDSKMQNAAGEQLSFEFLLYSKDFERVIHPFRRNLQRIGIKTSIRLVDVSQFINRLNNFEFDMLSLRKGQSISPGNEQASYWGCETADQVGTSNWAGLCSPVVDQLTKQLTLATTRKQLVDITRSLDRVLLSQHMVIPQWYLPAYRIAYWNKFNHPKNAPYYDLGIETWWAKPSEPISKEEGQ